MASNVVRIGLDELPAALEYTDRRIRRAIARGALGGAHRGRAVMVKRTPTDQGQLRASWKVRPGVPEFVGPESTLAELINDAPHVSIVEGGARPHGVNAEGWAAIYEWVRRHYRGGKDALGIMRRSLGGAGRMRARGPGITGPFKGSDPVISSITNAIVAKIKREGQKPTFFVLHSLDELRTVMAAELIIEIRRAEAQIAAERGRGGK